MLILAVAGGCASPVPGQVGVTGKVLIVTIQCYGPMYPQYYYYLVINRLGATGNLNARGPIPVLDVAIPGYGGLGNGFATGSQNANNMTNGVTDYGITDYVEYSQAVLNEIAVYHINGDPNNPNNAVANPQGVPQGGYTLPDPTNVDTNLASTLQFTLPVSQLITDGSTGTQLTNEVNAIHYIQVNIIATNQVPTNQTTASGKQVDSMGNSLSAADLSSFITIDLTQNKTYTDAGPYQTLTFPEPQGDVYPPGSPSNPSIDLQHWSIQVTQQ